MSNQNGGEAKAKERVPYEINVDIHEPFEPTIESKIIPAEELCHLVSNLFRSLFADYEGCFFDIGTSNDKRVPPIPSISILFNHGSYRDDRTVACELAGAKSTGSNTLDRMRTRDIRMKGGDRYTLTEDGKDIFSTLLIRNGATIHSNGCINWKNIVSEYIEGGGYAGYNFGMNNIQCTRVAFVDIGALCKVIYGDRTDDGDYINYFAKVSAAPVMHGMEFQIPPTQLKYMLRIERVINKTLEEAAKKSGMISMGSRIIR